MSEPTHEGRCLCGAVRYRVTGTPRFLGWCHCASCRRASGAPSVAWGTFQRDGFAIVAGTLGEYRSSPKVVRGFCAACGGALTYRTDTRPDDVDVTLASLEGAEALAPLAHVWVRDKLPWVRTDDGLPWFETEPEG